MELLEKIVLSEIQIQKIEQGGVVIIESTWDEFMDALDNKTGFVSAHWDGSSETEEKIKELSKATIRFPQKGKRLS